ncbi:MAG: glycosyl hydrolase family 18 protein, partial [Candidatus Pacebacteria bacterium]|nr:glycosyl hydrolase family 18 protein [Candidatus Paceibacterota bacterium]
MTAQKKPPIFYDKKHRRWRYSKRTLVPLVLFLATVFSVTLASVIIPPKLPKLDIQDPAGVYRSAPQSASGIAAASAPASLGAPGLQIPFMQNALLVGQAMDPVDPTTTKPKTLAYFVNWDDNSLVSLKQNLGSIDQLVPEWLNLSDNQGTVTPYNQSYQSDVWGYIQANRPSLRITPLIDNFNNQTQAFDGGRLSAMLENPALRTKTADSLLTYVQQNKFAGISIDFENVSNQDQPDLVLFMQELYQKFHPLGLEVTMNVPLDDSSFNYKALSQNADYLILMAYDEHDVYDTGPGPIASQPWFEAEIANRFSEVSAKKFIISLGNYGYDWSGDNPAPSGSGIDLTFEQAIQEAKKANAAVNLDSQSLNPTFDYTDANNILHHVWFLDGVSVYDQMVAAERSGAPAGFALWRLGAEDPTVWNDFINDKNLDASAAQALSNMQYGYDISYQGQGEILRVTETPQGGWRQINYDSASGLIKKTQIMSYPSPYVINRWGTGSKKIALTFDDGPDNKYTPQILDVLKKENASATFFVIGVNANFSPDIVREEYVNFNEIV